MQRYGEKINKKKIEKESKLKRLCHYIFLKIQKEDSFLMGNAKSRHKPSVANENSANVISNCKRIQKTAGGRPEEQKFRKSTTTIASAAKYNKTEYQHSLAADDGQQQQQRRLKQVTQNLHMYVFKI